MEDKTINSAENLLNSMEDLLLWSKGQMENFKPQPKTISVGSLFEDTRKHFSGQEKIDILFEDPQGLVLNTDENYLKTIIRNLTGNAIKALEKTNNAKIIWKAWQENGIKHLSITDNGPVALRNNLKPYMTIKKLLELRRD
ncbi:HAMP domain-containing histidine kinase [Flavobacterium lindanitolerans]|nr:HAMP domain-containing histidine kinase [Flavobacterium lindanitolerans]